MPDEAPRPRPRGGRVLSRGAGPEDAPGFEVRFLAWNAGDCRLKDGPPRPPPLPPRPAVVPFLWAWVWAKPANGFGGPAMSAAKSGERPLPP